MVYNLHVPEGSPHTLAGFYLKPDTVEDGKYDVKIAFYSLVVPTRFVFMHSSINVVGSPSLYL